MENNTYLELHSLGEIAVRLHSADIITFHNDGRVALNSGGWLTVTTKARINSYLPDGWRVWSERGQWLLGRAYSNPVCTFKDGMALHPDGRVEGGGSVAEWRQELREEGNARKRLRSRLPYWTRKAQQVREFGNFPTSRGLTVRKILGERNISIRIAMMVCYGTERFFLNAGAKVLDERAGYQLLSLEVDQRQHLRALKALVRTRTALEESS